ncbi:MAG: imidazole glycerol phosphate synthase subunit HisH [Clostridiales bacterium]|nr:imidazole glycerol phosphate synthase subunit HisH [Clostridiales bacterium]
MQYTAIIDYGVGNLLSVSKALSYLGIQSKITDDKKEIELADAVILPGVGAFADAMDLLNQKNLTAFIKNQAMKKPFLGICLGMQLLFDDSEEMGYTKGLSLIDGSVKRINTTYKLPQIGWNCLEIVNPSPLTKNLPEKPYVYFVHSFAAEVKHSENLSAVCDYGTKVTALVSKKNLFGCQFHPEKSGDIGLIILKNFGELFL